MRVVTLVKKVSGYCIFTLSFHCRSHFIVKIDEGYSLFFSDLFCPTAIAFIVTRHLPILPVITRNWRHNYRNGSFSLCFGNHFSNVPAITVYHFVRTGKHIVYFFSFFTGSFYGSACARIIIKSSAIVMPKLNQHIVAFL